MTANCGKLKPGISLPPDFAEMKLLLMEMKVRPEAQSANELAFSPAFRRGRDMRSEVKSPQPTSTHNAEAVIPAFLCVK